MAHAKAIGHEKIDRMKLPCPCCGGKRYAKLIADRSFPSGYACERCIYTLERNRGNVGTAAQN